MSISKIIKNQIKNFDTILIALVLNMNVLRFFLGIYETNLLLYCVYLLCIIVLFSKYHRNVRYLLAQNRKLKRLYIGFCFIMAYAFLSLIWCSSDSGFSSVIKLIIALLIAGLSTSLGVYKAKMVLIYSGVINFIYGMIILLSPDRIDGYMTADVNYLNMTLTLGFIATTCLVCFIASFYEKAISLLTIFMALLTVLFFASLMHFSARGVLLIPPIIAFCVILLEYRSNKVKSGMLLVLLAFILSFAIAYFISNASQLAVSRMTSLFEYTEDEDRLQIWSDALNGIIDNFWFVFGGGVEAFKSQNMIYPHNIFIQYLGEYGIWGLSVLLSFLFLCFKGVVRSIKMPVDSKSRICLYAIMAAFTYYLLTFNKSFSIYEGCPLYLTMTLCFSVVNDIIKSNYGISNNNNS